MNQFNQTDTEKPLPNDLESLTKLYFDLCLVEEIGVTTELTARLDRLESIIREQLAKKDQSKK